MDSNMYSFWDLINYCPIVIPQVQRDYAYGRSDEKAVKVLDIILSAMHGALVDENDNDAAPLAMDFVYGSKDDTLGITPLDGQQRLTTLFLLHLYASVKEPGGKELRTPLLRFRYETRQSANDFCRKLIQVFEYDAKSSIPLSRQIVNDPHYLPSYDTDPTISCMLVVLDKIRDRFGDIDNLWDKLTRRHRIYFYFLPLDQFGLSDDLFIKMNSRGKPLTSYELYKSDFEEFLEHHYPEKKEYFSKNLDTIWTDMLWEQAGEDVTKVDDGFMNLFTNITTLVYHLRTDANFTEEEFNKSEDRYHALPFERKFVSLDEVNIVQGVFDMYYRLFKDGFSFWEKHYYFGDGLLDDGSSRIAVFRWRNKESLFSQATKGRLTRAQLIVFYALLRGISGDLDDGTLSFRLRHLQALVTNSENELRGSRLHGMLVQTRDYIDSGVMPNDYFNSIQLEEEKLKDSLPHVEWQSLWKYENHPILQYSLMLFLKAGRKDLLEKFVHIFDKDYAKNLTLLRTAFLAAGARTKDYAQHLPWMDEPKYLYRKMLVVNNEMWNTFFTLNTNRRNQEAIIECLDDLPQNSSDLAPYLKQVLSTLSKKDWRYYLIKYPEEWRTVRSYTPGVYFWENPTTRPLEAIMLNSTSHGVTNLEWNILNSTLRWGPHSEHYSIDDHNHAPVVLVNANSSLDGNQDGWRVSTYEDDYLLNGLRTLTNPNGTLKYDITPDNNVLVPDGMDYIDFAWELTKDIEAIYAKQH